jgi:Cu/Ag efflux protein CusF
MRKPILLALMLMLLGAGGAQAQWQGGGGRHHGGGAGGGQDSGSDSSRPPSSRRDTPVAPDQVAIVGVVKGFGPEPDRVTISYDPVDALNWPAGTTPFVVTNPALLSGITVGEKVRFKIESAHIYVLQAAQ